MAPVPPPLLAYESTGTGPAVVLVAGLAGLGRFWQPIVGPLSSTRRVVTFDHPGVGASPVRGPQRIDTIAQAVLELMDALEIACFVCVGHSTGGLVAQQLALEQPDRISGLVLSSTWARPDRHFRDLFALRRLVLQHAGLAAYELHGRLLAYPPGWYETHVSAMTAAIMSPHEDTVHTARIAERIDMLLAYDRADDLGSITQPTLILAAPDDQIVPLHHARQLAQRIPQASLRLLRGGHFPPVTDTTAYVQALLGFLPAADAAA